MAALVLTLAVGERAAAQPAAEPVEVRFVSPLVKVRAAEDVATGETTPALFAARGEAESLQLALLGRGRAVEVRVTCAGLRREGPDGEGAAPLPVRFDRVGTVTVTRPSITREPADRLRKAAAFLGAPFPPVPARPAVWPDPLLPDDRLEVPPRGHALAWLTVEVPREAPAGEYLGRLRLEVRVAGDGAPVTLQRELRLRVWPVTLPARPTLRTSFGLSTGQLAQRVALPDGPAREALAAAHARALASARLSRRFVARPTVSVDEARGEVRVDWRAFDAAVEDALAAGASGFDMDWFHLPRGWTFASDDLRTLLERGPAALQARYEEVRRRLRDPAARRVAAALLAQTEAHLAERGWLDLGYVYLVDEPFVLALPTLREQYRFVKQAAPRLRVLQTVNEAAVPGAAWLGVGPLRSLAGLVDVWVVTASLYRPRRFRPLLREGDEVWVYSCIGSGRPVANCWQIDAPGAYNQVGFWVCHQLALDGYLYWETLDWSRADPWSDPMTYPGGNGDGALFYPWAGGVVRAPARGAVRPLTTRPPGPGGVERPRDRARPAGYRPGPERRDPA